MPQLGSPISTPAGMPVPNAAHLGKFVGLKKTFENLAALNTAITTDKASPLWKNNEEVSVAAEAPAIRLWDITAKHARTVRIESLQFVLDADDDNVLFGVGIPAGSTGLVGDVSVDFLGRMVYKKTGATTWVTRYKLNAVVPVAPTVTQASPLPLSAMNCMTPVDTASPVVLTLPPAADAFALQPFGVIMVFVLGNGVPTFAAAGSDTIGVNANAAPGVKNSTLAIMVKSATEWVQQ